MGKKDSFDQHKTGVTMEDLDSKLGLVLEHVVSQGERLDRVENRLDSIDDKLEKIEVQLEGKADISHRKNKTSRGSA